MRPEIRARLAKPNEPVKTYRWQEHLAEVIAGVEASSEELDRATVEAILHLNRRTALRLMERFDPVEGTGGVWRIRRDALLAWLHDQQEQQTQTEQRTRKVHAALTEGRKQDAELRAALARAGKPVAVWTVPENAHAANMRGLPDGVRIMPGRIEIDAPIGAPLVAAERLHALALAMMNDWDGFVRIFGPPTDHSEASLAQFESALQAAKQDGLDMIA